MFTPLQLQPQVLARWVMEGWARWIDEYLVSFPRLIRDHRLSIVYAGLQISYVRPLRFHDAERLNNSMTVTVHGGGKLMVLTLRVCTGDTEVARAVAVVRTVNIEDADTLSARPGVLSPAILQRFAPDEVSDARTSRYVADLARSIEDQGRLVATGEHPLFVHRHVCEVADQWSFIDLPAHVAASREQLALERGHENRVLLRGLEQPLGTLDAEYRRPFYAFDAGRVVTRVYEHAGELGFVHELLSDIGNRAPHAVVVERFRDASRPGDR